MTGAIVGFDTATPATAVAVLREDGHAVAARHDPASGERPGHMERLLPLLAGAMAEAEVRWGDVGRLAVGVGPGTFTGLRIGIATARGLALARSLPLAGVPTLAALAAGEVADAGATILAVLDARRSEAFAAAYAAAGGRELMAPAALGPDALEERARALAAGAPPGGPVLAIGSGATLFRDRLEAAGTVVPDDGAEVHRLDARALCRLAHDAGPAACPGAVVPVYVRLPDAELAHRHNASS